jgi:hypothetical protein
MDLDIDSLEDTMDSLKIQDAFEPYYAGRKSFPSKLKQRAAIATSKRERRQMQQKRPVQAVHTGKASKTTEH